MLWNIIRDWFVQYIFGGYLSNGQPASGAIVGMARRTTGVSDFLQTTTYYVPIGGYGSEQLIGVNIGDWLSTTATIITLVLLVVMLLAMVRFIVRQVSGLFAKI